MRKMKPLLSGRMALVLGTWIAYALAFMPLYGLMGAGAMVSALAMLPVIVTAWFYGMWAGLFAGLLAFPLNVLLITLTGGSGWGMMSHSASLLGSFLLALVGMVVGRLRDLDERVKWELAERKRAEEKLREANLQLQAALSAKNEMIQNVSHELRTPLTTISGYVELLGEAALGPVTAEQAQALEVMSRQAKQLYFMVNRLLTLQTIDARGLQKSEVEPGLLLHQAVEAWQARTAAAGIRFDLEVAPDIPVVEVDVDLLNQVFDNLLDNAVKFSPAGGVVRVRAWAAQSGVPEGCRVLISVADSGIGISADKVEQVFERFYQADGSTTRRFGGAGIGLALCRKIVAAHGGRIWAESDGERQGSTFYVALP
ncbi:MAG: hypothetical protein AUK03_05390 [Anaerolineae bacterium CG2_30_64_16]|nr:MAG: hypothetical protein AUK03_05390 [Anaerolineae bacterium CG2_30_64_16]